MPTTGSRRIRTCTIAGLPTPARPRSNRQQRGAPRSAPRRMMTMSQTTNFVFLLVEDFTHLAFSNAVESLRIANLMAERDLYSWQLASVDGRSARCSNGAVTLVDQGLSPLGRDDRLMIVSGINVQNHTRPDLLRYLRAERARGTQIGAICSGAYILAEAGFLDGRRAAVHWEFHDVFAERFPSVNLTRSVFVADEKFVTA